MVELTYCFFDIEVHGPTPGANSLLSIGCAAYNDNAGLVGELYSANLMPLHEASGDLETMAWWNTQPETWEKIRTEPHEPSLVIHDLLVWLDALPKDLVFAAHPLLFDGLWVDWYLRKFSECRLFKGPFRGISLFVGAGIDVPSYVQAALDVPYFRSRPTYPAHLLGNIEHSHVPIDDAKGHGSLYFNARSVRERGESYRNAEWL